MIWDGDTKWHPQGSNGVDEGLCFQTDVFPPNCFDCGRLSQGDSSHTNAEYAIIRLHFFRNHQSKTGLRKHHINNSKLPKKWLPFWKPKQWIGITFIWNNSREKYHILSLCCLAIILTSMLAYSTLPTFMCRASFPITTFWDSGVPCTSDAMLKCRTGKEMQHPRCKHALHLSRFWFANFILSCLLPSTGRVLATSDTRQLIIFNAGTIHQSFINI